MSKNKHQSVANVVTFKIDHQSFAIPLELVIRVEQSVATDPLPGAPEHIIGVINHHGHILPVINLRTQFGLPPKTITTNDQFLLVKCHNCVLVLPVDKVEGVVAHSTGVAPEALIGVPAKIQTITALPSGTVMITLPEKLLQGEEMKKIDNLVQNLKNNEHPA